MRSKPDPVDQPERTAHYDCAILCNMHCWNATQHYSTETVLLIFPFLQTNITVQMRPSGGYGSASSGTHTFIASQYSQTAEKRTLIRNNSCHVSFWPGRVGNQEVFQPRQSGLWHCHQSMQPMVHTWLRSLRPSCSHFLRSPYPADTTHTNLYTYNTQLPICIATHISIFDIQFYFNKSLINR